MLQELRNSAGTWIVKALIMLLVASFAVWGIEGYIGGGGGAVVATVGERQIDANEFQDDFRRQLSMLQRQTGQRIDSEQAKELGLPEQLLQQQVDQLLLEQTADRLNLRAPDNLLRTLILQNPMFQSAGQFDRLRFENFLAQNGMSEGMYVALLREDLRNQAIAESVAAGLAPAPAGLTDTLANYEGEHRRLTYLVVPKTGADLSQSPDETALRAFYREHPERFSAPELRGFSWLKLSPEAIAATIQLDEQAIRTAYAERLQELSVPATRQIRQVVVADEETAREIAAAARGGLALADAAGSAGSPVELGALSQPELAGLLGDSFAAEVFAPGETGVLPALESPLGWHVVEVTALAEGSEPSFEEVRDRLAAELRQEQAIDRIYGLANQVEDLIAGGARLREISETMGLPAESHPGIDGTGRDIDGRPVDVLPEWGGMRRALWRMQQGDEPETHEDDMGEGFTVLQLDQISPPQLRPFEDVEDRVAEAWVDEQLALAADERADRIAREIGAGQSLSGIAAETGLQVLSPAPVNRQGVGAELGFEADLLRRMFLASPGEVITGRTRGSEAVVARLEEVLPPTAIGEVEMARQRAGDRWSRGFNNDLAEAFRNDLAQRIGVSINRAALDNL